MLILGKMFYNYYKFTVSLVCYVKFMTVQDRGQRLTEPPLGAPGVSGEVPL